MVTHGYVAFKYESIYYIYYNHSDSYYSYLGEKIVNEIYKMIDKDYIKYYKKKLLRIPLKDDMTDGDSNFDSIYSSILDYEYQSYFTSEYEPNNQYNYIIDFDEEEFIIITCWYDYDNRYTFDLLNIPDNWREIVENTKYYMYENKEQIKNDKIKAKILELEEEINKLKLNLCD